MTFLSPKQPDNDIAPPRVSPELIEFLERVYPLSAFKNCQTVENLRTYQGAHEVIDLLKTLFDRQNGDADVLLDTETTDTGSAG